MNAATAPNLVPIMHTMLKPIHATRVKERERETDRQTHRHTDRHTHTQSRDRETQTQTETEKERGQIGQRQREGDLRVGESA